METPASIHGSTREQLKQQLAHYLEQQPESIQAIHRWMKRLHAAGMGIIIAAFIMALYVSFTWRNINPLLIPVAWFFFAASPSILLIFLGMHTVLLRAFPTVILPGKAQRFVSGSSAIWIGFVFIAGGLLLAAFWISFIFSMGTFNMTMIGSLINIIGIVIGVGIVIQIINQVYSKILKMG